MSARTKKHEGFRARPYKDPGGGALAVGYGFKMDEPHVSKLIPNEVKLGIRDMTTQEADSVFNSLYSQAQLDAMAYTGKDTWKTLDPVRQEVLTDLSYQLGSSKLNTFKKVKENLKKGDYVKASQEIINSKYAKQVPVRAQENAKLLMLGQLKPQPVKAP